MVTVYTQNLCGYCSYAKMYLERMDIPFEEINIDENKQAREFLREQGHRTTPQIYHNDKLLVEGGCDGLRQLSKEEIKERMGDLGLDNLSL